MSIAIKVENLSKKYIIRHEKQSAHYETFSDTLILSSKSIAKKIIHPFRDREIDRITEEEFWALKDIGFEIQQGDKVGVIGRNGAGKSTLLKVLSRITEPTVGKIHINGRIASLLEVGTGFHPELTGRENVFLNGAILGMSRVEIKNKFDEIVDFAEVEKFLDTPVKRYSSGMYVRLAFAVAAHLEPEILVVDEVLAVGDVQFQKKCLGKMGEVSKEGRTILFVSHNMGSINQLCSKCIWMKDGKIVDYGDSKKVIAEYLVGQPREGEYKWKNGIANKGIKELCLNSVRIENSVGKITSEVNASEPFFISISYEVFVKLTNCRIGFVITSSDGMDVIESYDLDFMTQSIVKETGKSTVKCNIPEYTLIPGVYIISINIGIPNDKNLVHKEAILKISIQDSDSFLTHMNTKRKGIIYPKFIWSLAN